MAEAERFADHRPLCYCRLVFDWHHHDACWCFPFCRKSLDMVRRKAYWLLGSVVITFLLGCSSKEKNAPSDSSDQTVEERVYEQPVPQSTEVPMINRDSLNSNSISDTHHNSYSGINLSVNPYYDAGYEQGQEDGYDDGVQNLRGDSYDDACLYKGKARKEYELGYEEGYETGFDDGFSDSDYNSEEEE